MTLVVAAVVFLDPSLQLPPDCQVGEVALPRFFFHFIPRQYTDKCKQDTESLPPLFGPLTQTLVPVSKGGPGGWEPLRHLSDVKTEKLVPLGHFKQAHNQRIVNNFSISKVPHGGHFKLVK